MLNSCSLQPGLPAWMGAVRPGSKVQFTIFSLDTCELPCSTEGLLPGGPDTYFLPQSRNIVHYIRVSENLHNIPNKKKLSSKNHIMGKLIQNIPGAVQGFVCEPYNPVLGPKGKLAISHQPWGLSL